MSPATNPDLLKQAVKDALAEVLEERRDLLQDIFAEVLEEFALAEAIREGPQTGLAGRDEVFGALETDGQRVIPE